MRRIILLCCAVWLMSVAAHEVGGDISLLTRYEQNGAKYYDKDGKAITDMLAFFKQQGWTTMRVRLFVDPSQASDEDKGQGVCQDLEYVKALGARIKAAGFKLMLDFHYSDSWADPAKQYTPAAWASLTDAQLYDQIYTYTKDCLEAMVAANARPDFIQTGNEISYGMLWGAVGTGTNSFKRCFSGSDANWNRFTTLLKNAGKACREVCPNAKIILHTERLSNAGVLTNFYNKMKTAQVDYDIIGTSYYSYYHGNLDQLHSSLTVLERLYPDKDIMVVEAGYFHAWQPGDVAYDLSATYPITDAGQKAFTEAMIATLKKHERVTGLFWWWPEANEYGLDWSTKRVTDGWYNAGLWDNSTGRVMNALYVLRDFLPPALQGDVNADGVVDVSDVNILINIILGRERAEDYAGRANVNGDAAVDVSDVNALIDIVMGGSQG